MTGFSTLEVCPVAMMGLLGFCFGLRSLPLDRARTVPNLSTRDMLLTLHVILISGANFGATPGEVKNIKSGVAKDYCAK